MGDQFWENLEQKEKENDLKDINMNENEEKKNGDDRNDNERKSGYLKEYILKQIYSMIRNVFKIGSHKLNEGFSYNFSNDIKNHGRCFDILGMDVLIDTNYKCWLLEFNRYPSLKCSHQIDRDIKYNLCNDLFTMLKPRII